MPAQNPVADATDALLMLLKESLDFHRQADVRAVLGEALAILCRLRKRLQWINRPYLLALVGLSNVGKSTLLNALLGHELSPSRNGPCTTLATEFLHANEFRVSVHDPSTFRQRAPRTCRNPEEVWKFLLDAASGTVDGPVAARGRIVVHAPCEILAGGLVLVDTPGFGAAQADGSHEASLREYLRGGVAQVFWIVLGEQAITAREKAFYDSFLADVCDDIVVTGCDDWTADDQAKFRKRFAGVFAHRLPVFHFVSGLQGLRARRTQDAILLERSGVLGLQEHIAALARPASRSSALQGDLEQLLRDLGCWLNDFRDQAGQALSTWWRPDSWERWLEVLPGNDLAERLTLYLEEDHVS